MSGVDTNALTEALKASGGMGDGPAGLDIPDAGFGKEIVAELEAEQQDMKAAEAAETPSTTLEGMASKNGISPQFAADMLTGAGLPVVSAAEWSEEAALKVGLWLQDAITRKRSPGDYVPQPVENLSPPTKGAKVIKEELTISPEVSEADNKAVTLVIYFESAEQAEEFKRLVDNGRAMFGSPSNHRVVLQAVAPVVHLQESEWKDV
jgi:hypothetical protein